MTTTTTDWDEFKRLAAAGSSFLNGLLQDKPDKPDNTETLRKTIDLLTKIIEDLREENKNLKQQLSNTPNPM